MSKEEKIKLNGVVVDILPNATFKVRVTNAGQTYVILAHISGRIRLANINILQGDKVTIEMSPYDMSKGRIVWRDK